MDGALAFDAAADAGFDTTFFPLLMTAAGFFNFDAGALAAAFLSYACLACTPTFVGFSFCFLTGEFLALAALDTAFFGAFLVFLETF